MGVLAVVINPDVINPDEGDLALSEGGRMFLRERTPDVVAQRLAARVALRLGEWFLNLDAGLPIFEHLLDKPTEAQARALLSDLIRTTEGVRSVDELRLTFDRRRRECTVDFEATLTDGATFSSKSFAPFVLSQVSR